MHWDSALGSVIEVSIGLAGFSGIVAAVGRRGAGGWTGADQVRLRVLVLGSGLALAFAFLPLVLVDAIGPDLAWRVSSALLATQMIYATVRRILESAQIGSLESVGWSRFGVVPHLLVIAAVLANALVWSSPSLYVSALLWVLLLAFHTFYALLMESSHEPTPKHSISP